MIGSMKRKTLNEEEKIINRERNRGHAHKSRERKKLYCDALKARALELNYLGTALRVAVDELYLSYQLMGLSMIIDDADNVYPGSTTSSAVQVRSSSQICGNIYSEFMLRMWDSDGMEVMGSFDGSNAGCGGNGGGGSVSNNSRIKKRQSRLFWEFSPEERNHLRRERNRLHAKCTRDKRKSFIQSNEDTITDMECENVLLRQYLYSFNEIELRDIDEANMRDACSRQELLLFKNTQLRNEAIELSKASLFQTTQAAQLAAKNITKMNQHSLIATMNLEGADARIRSAPEKSLEHHAGQGFTPVAAATAKTAEEDQEEELEKPRKRPAKQRPSSSKDPSPTAGAAAPAAWGSTGAPAVDATGTTSKIASASSIGNLLLAAHSPLVYTAANCKTVRKKNGQSRTREQNKLNKEAEISFATWLSEKKEKEVQGGVHDGGGGVSGGFNASMRNGSRSTEESNGSGGADVSADVSLLLSLSTQSATPTNPTTTIAAAAPLEALPATVLPPNQNSPIGAPVDEQAMIQEGDSVILENQTNIGPHGDLLVTA